MTSIDLIHPQNSEFGLCEKGKLSENNVHTRASFKDLSLGGYILRGTIQRSIHTLYMYMYMNMYVRMYVCAYVCVYVCMYVCVYVYTVCMYIQYVCMCICIIIRVHSAFSLVASCVLLKYTRTDDVN